MGYFQIILKQYKRYVKKPLDLRISGNTIRPIYRYMSKKVEDYFYDRPARWLYTFVVNIVTILVFGATGYALDSYLGTKPWIFIALLIISFPVSIFIQYRKIKQL